MELPQNLKEAADKALQDLISEKSKEKYDKAYTTFKKWQAENNVAFVNENVLLAYFQQLSEKHKPTSLWVYYSMLRSTLNTRENVDIKAFSKLYSFIKRQNVGNVVKKAKVLSDDDLKTFFKTAKDEEYLLAKVVAIFGVFGACRCDEIYNLTINDVKEEGSVIVTINKCKIYKPRFFTIIPDGDIGINSVEIVKKYMTLRPKHAKHEHFFVFYNRGIHKISSVPRTIATFLGLPNVELYIGHCLRRTSATILANNGGNVTDLKRLGRWKSSSVAEGYVEESVGNKIKMAKRMFSSGESCASTSTVQAEIDCATTILPNNGGNVTDLKRLGEWESSSVTEQYVEESVGNKIKMAKRMLSSGESSTYFSSSSRIVYNENTTEIVDNTEVALPGNIILWSERLRYKYLPL